MADAGLDITEEEGVHPIGIDKRESFHTINKDFGVINDDVPNLDNDPIQPGRKRILFLACLCILGGSLSARGRC
jgi:hypothetical protein